MSNETEAGTPVLELKTAYPDLLNALSEMQESPAYAVRKGVLAKAERTIFQLECELAAANTKAHQHMMELVGAKASIAQLNTMLSAANAKAEQYRVSLEMISGKHQCIDGLMSNEEIAREALEGK